MLVQFIRTLSFPVILGDIDDLTDLCFNLFNRASVLGKLARLKEGTNGGLEQRERKSGIFHGSIFFGWSARLESGMDGDEVGGFFA